MEHQQQQASASCDSHHVTVVVVVVVVVFSQWSSCIERPVFGSNPLSLTCLVLPSYHASHGHCRPLPVGSLCLSLYLHLSESSSPYSYSLSLTMFVILCLYWIRIVLSSGSGSGSAVWLCLAQALWGVKSAPGCACVFVQLWGWQLVSWSRQL